MYWRLDLEHTFLRDAIQPTHLLKKKSQLVLSLIPENLPEIK